MPTNGGNGDERTNGTPEALAFWGEPDERPGDAAWKKWRRSLAEAKAGIDALKAMSVEWGVSLERQKAEAEAKIAFHEARTARLQIEAEIAHAAFERTLYRLRGGRVQ